ncbi:hypothetical protein NPIL_88481 [Nephila pilipes]|uniref:Uncharacterized protein n=1 Tax=Nephila pilipes TaxID=299642 RepID=A0A8X6QP09_NEPPI|nr:hypothetical protein NPIL_88481 [Nephila pilipes]
MIVPLRNRLMSSGRSPPKRQGRLRKSDRCCTWIVTDNKGTRSTGISPMVWRWVSIFGVEDESNTVQISLWNCYWQRKDLIKIKMAEHSKKRILNMQEEEKNSLGVALREKMFHVKWGGVQCVC